jgi:hypothetical protein
MIGLARIFGAPLTVPVPVSAGQVAGRFAGGRFFLHGQNYVHHALKCVSLTFIVSAVSGCLAQIWFPKSDPPFEKASEFQIFTHRESLHDPLAFF